MNGESRFLRTVCQVTLDGTGDRLPVYESVLDEERLFRFGLYHQILPLIAHHRDKLKIAFPALSDEFFEKSRNYLVTNVGRVMYYERFLADLDDRLTTEGVEYRLFKGPVLAYELYQLPYLRTFGDLDILIQEKSLEKVHRIITGLNCELCDDLYIAFPDVVIKKYSFARHYTSVKSPFVAIDVHLSLSNRLHPFQFDIADFWLHSRTFRLGDRDYQTFDRSHQALYLLYHAFKHYFFKLIWVIDCQQNFQSPDFDLVGFKYLLKKYNLVRLWEIYNQVAADLWDEKSQLNNAVPRRRRIKIIKTDLILQGGLATSPSRARMLLPMLYLPKLSQKLVYLWRQMFPPREVVRDFYVSKDLKPTWRNYLSLRRKAVAELFND